VERAQTQSAQTQHVQIEYVHIERDGAVGTLHLARPERFNSLDPPTARQLRRAGLQLARDPAVRCVVLRGEPGMFCSGVDLKDVRAGGEPSELGYLRPAGQAEPAGAGSIFKEVLEYLHSTISEIRRSPKPWIAAVDGIAAAGGLGLALCCDLVVASERATFEYAYLKTGLCGAESSTFFLPRLVGLRRALDLALLGQRLDAHTAMQWGLVSAVFPQDRFEDEATALARRLAEGPTAAIAAAKGLLNASTFGERLDLHLDHELEALVRTADSADFAEGLAAFFAHRAPVFLPPSFPGG